MPKPAGVPDWFLVEWGPIYERTRFAPLDIPGVRELSNGRSQRNPWPHEVHRSHLALLGFSVPPVAKVSSAEILRPHQHAAVDFIRARRGTLLADEMRVGKSASTMYAFEAERGPMLVVGPVAARAVWSEWAHRRFGACVQAALGESCATCKRLGIEEPNDHPSFLPLDGRSYKPELVVEHRPHVLFCTLAVVSTWRELSTSLLANSTINSLGMLVVDECHMGGVTNRKSLTNESLKWLNSITERVVLLSGTPMPNKPAGLWPLLDLVAPAAFGPFWDAARRYFDAKPTEHGWRADGLSHEQELKLRLQEIMLRRTWAEVAPGLPPITRSIETVAISQKQRDDIEEVAARLRYQGGNAKTVVGIMARLRRLFAEAKLEAGVEATLATLRDGHNVVVWVWHQDTAQKLTERLQGQGVAVYGPITGKVIGREREHILDEARDAKGPRVLVANIAALGTAVSLTWAAHEVFVELDWNPHSLQQSEMRIFSPDRACSAVYLVADCPTDENLIAALLSKLENQATLDLRAGVGDVADVLQQSLKLEGQTLNDLATRLCENAEGEI